MSAFRRLRSYFDGRAAGRAIGLGVAIGSPILAGIAYSNQNNTGRFDWLQTGLYGIMTLFIAGSSITSFIYSNKVKRELEREFGPDFVTKENYKALRELNDFLENLEEE